MLLHTATFLLLVTTVFSFGHFVLLAFHFGFFEVWKPYRCIVSLLISLFVAMWGLKRKSIDRSGAIAGIFVGTVISFASYCFTACLLVFFYTSSKATRLHGEQKKKIEAAYKEGGQRDWVQVMCNGGAAAEFALLYALHNGAGECALDFNNNFTRSWLAVAVLSALAGANGDTWASEIGSVFSIAEPRLITSLRKVPIGTNGGVSHVGIFVSALGGLVVGLGYFITLSLVSSEKLENQAILLLLIGGFAGLFGSLVDSVIGATLQFSGIDMMTGKIVQDPGPFVKKISGRPVLSNHSVNMAMTYINSIVVPTITASIYSYFVL